MEELALRTLHECQHTIHVALRFAVRRNSVIMIYGAEPGVVRRDDVLHRRVAVAIPLDQEAEITGASVDILRRNPRIGAILLGC